MKKKVVQYFSVAIFFGITIAACNTHGHKNIPVTKEKITGSYKLTALSSRPETGVSRDIIGEVSACEKDDVMKINTDYTVEFIDGSVQCTPAGDYSSTWSLAGNKIIIDGEENTIQWFDGVELVLLSIDDTKEQPVSLVSTYTKQ